VGPVLDYNPFPRGILDGHCFNVRGKAAQPTKTALIKKEPAPGISGSGPILILKDIGVNI